MGYWNTRGLRGSNLEELINLTNAIYTRRGIGVIQKVSTPITPVEVNNKEHTITKAYFEKKSTVDYIGVSRGKALCFDAKETSRSALPMQNVHRHQLEFMEQFENQGGVSFLLVSFSLKAEVFFMTYRDLLAGWTASQNGDRKSIPYDAFAQRNLVKNEEGFPLHYLRFLH
ncbi:MAG: Holliday junction resolvase RecU [Clostridiales bacterium]|jgi:recombination protein U|nr:Holliday junction resolvase RecU [Clostridiales bacterium]